MVLEYKEGASQSETQGTEMVGGLIRNSSFPGQGARMRNNSKNIIKLPPSLDKTILKLVRMQFSVCTKNPTQSHNPGRMFVMGSQARNSSCGAACMAASSQADEDEPAIPFSSLYWAHHIPAQLAFCTESVARSPPLASSPCK